MKAEVTLHDYEPAHQPWFEQFNRAWIEKYFYMEAIDVAVLQQPGKHIIERGGWIIMASVQNEVAGTVALKFVAPGVYEFTKMAVAEQYQGKGIGRALSEAAIAKARQQSADAIILYSNRQLKTAIALYKTLGFIEIPIDGIYARADIKMKLILDHSKHPFGLYDIRKAARRDATVLTQLGRSTFHDTFADLNTKANMDLYLEQSYTIEQLSKELEEAGSTFLIAFDGDVEIGFAKLKVNAVNPEELRGEQTIELQRLYCIKEYKGKKVGSSLMQASVTLAKKQGYDSMWLGVWEHNTTALRFYEKWGFTKIGSHPFILGKDIQTDLLLKKIL